MDWESIFSLVQALGVIGIGLVALLRGGVWVGRIDSRLGNIVKEIEELKSAINGITHKIEHNAERLDRLETKIQS